MWTTSLSANVDACHMRPSGAAVNKRTICTRRFRVCNIWQWLMLPSQPGNMHEYVALKFVTQSARSDIFHLSVQALKLQAYNLRHLHAAVHRYAKAVCVCSSGLGSGLDWPTQKSGNGNTMKCSQLHSVPDLAISEP